MQNNETEQIMNRQDRHVIKTSLAELSFQKQCFE